MGRRHPLDPPAWLKATLITVTIAYIGIVVLLPLASVFTEAFGSGMPAWLEAISEPDAQAAIRLTLLVAAIAVPLNCVFGVIASWAIAKHDFPGKALLVSLIDLPFSVSTGRVRACLCVAVRREWVDRPLLQEHNIEIIFALPGIVLATVFVTFPLVARELIPVDAIPGPR